MRHYGHYKEALVIYIGGNKDDELHDVRSQVEHGFKGNMQVYGLGSLS